MPFIHPFQVLLMITLLVEFNQGKTVLKLHRSTVRDGDKREKAVITKKGQTEEISNEEGFSANSQDSLSSSASLSTSVEHIYRRHNPPSKSSGKIPRSAPSRRSASSSSSTSESDEQLPAEKGDLGIPEQLMKVRHGVYKGQMAVFVDSQSTEDDDVRSSKGGSSKSSSGNEANGGDYLKKYSSRPTTTTTTTTTLRPTPPRNPLKSKVVHQSPPRTTGATKNPKTKKATAKVTPKSTTSTAATTTTTRLPIVNRQPPPPPPPPAASTRQQLRKDGLENFVMQVPPKYHPKSTPSPVRQHKNHSSCLSLGRQCRRHNECCTHHCNWRMGMKCDYQAF